MQRDDHVREEIRNRVDIVELISSYVTLKRTGASYKGLCPFHEEKTPSFSVIPKLQRYHCFGCHEKGDAFSFVMKMENLSFPEAMKRLADRVGIRYEPRARSAEEISLHERLLSLHQEATKFFQDVLLKSEEAEHAREYVRRRGLNTAMVREFRIGYAPNDWEATLRHLRGKRFTQEEIVQGGLALAREAGAGAYDRFRNRLMFPIFDLMEQVIAFGGRTLSGEDAKYINTPETLLFTKGRTLYGLHRAAEAIRKQDQIIVVEGYMDLIALHQHELENSVATMGTAITPAHLQVLRRYSRDLVAAFDGDSSGMNAILRSASLFDQQEMTVRVLRIGREEDPDTFLRAQGREAFMDRLQQAVPLIDYRIDVALTGHEAPRSDADFQNMVRDVLPALLEVRDHLARELQIMRVAERWSAGDARRAQSITAAIKQKLSRAARAPRALETPNRPAQELSEPATLIGNAPQSGMTRAERALCALALADFVAARVIFGELAAADWEDPAYREIMAALERWTGSSQKDSFDEQEARSFVEQLSPDSSDVAAQLFIEEVPNDPRSLHKLIERVRTTRARRRLQDKARQAGQEIDAGQFTEIGQELKDLAAQAKPSVRN